MLGLGFWVVMGGLVVVCFQMVKVVPLGYILYQIVLLTMVGIANLRKQWVMTWQLLTELWYQFVGML